MKQTLLIGIILFLTAGSLFAQEDPVTVYEPKFQPQSPEIMAQGGSFTANAKGYNSLFTNPAGFSTGKGSLTIASANPWAYFFPDPETIAAVQTVVDDPAAGISALNTLLTTTGTGLGAQAGIGFVGSGFGLGLVVMNDTFAYGPNTFGVQVDTGFTAAVIAGVSFPIHLGEFTITPAGAVRPMYRLRAYDVGFSSLTGLITNPDPSAVTAEVLAGVGFGIDLGLNASYGPLTVALAVRDFGGTKFGFGSLSVAEVIESFEAGSLPSGTPVEGYEFVIPMSLHAGAEFHPDLGGLSFLIDPSVHAEYVMTSGVESSFWTNLHLGAEVRVLRMLRLRAGLNQGYTTLGVGLKLLFLEAHVAYFGREIGSYAGARQNQGVTAEVALRF